MNIRSIYNNLSNKTKLSLLSRKNAKEVSELCNDIKTNTPYKDIKLQINSRNNVRVMGKEGNCNSLTVDFDFANNIQNQIEKTKGYVFSIIHPYRETTQEVRGTIDGNIKRVKTTTVERNKTGLSFLKTTEYQNCISGNKFKREETENGVKFFKSVDGDFVEMFTKK